MGINMHWELLLHGTWNFRLDDSQVGIQEGWQGKEFTDSIQIPGILQDQGYGYEISETTPWISGLHDKLWYQREEYKTDLEGVNVPFLCQPKGHYLGPAWYQKTFTIPSGLKDHVFYFTMEVVKWKTTVWIDGKCVGSEISLCTPHVYCLGELDEGEHTIVVCIDNGYQYPYRPDGHMVSDALGATWNGMAGKVAISSVPYVHIENVKVFPDADKKEIKAEVTVRNHKAINQEVNIRIGERQLTTTVEQGSKTCTLLIDYPQDNVLWDEFSANIHEVTAVLEFEGFKDEKTVSFGICKIEVKDGLFYVNNRPAFFRGTHSGGDFPLTGYPSTSVEDWRKIIKTCQSYGLNYIRFHSYCPPKAAFIAADEEGMYLQVECGMWNNFYDGSKMNEVLWDETKRIIDNFGNHPSFVMLSPSNEPGSAWYKPLTDWVLKCREYDSRRLYTAQSGWPYPVEPGKVENTDYLYFHRSGFGIKPGGTIRNFRGWHGKDYRESLEGAKLPVISHELGQWCSYPDFDVIDKFTGYLQPGSYRVYREHARRRGVLPQNKEFAYLSGKLKVQLYKEELEATFRTPHIYGFELLDIHDYIGQGTALVGFLDPFWEDKGIISGKEFQEFCSETVPLLRISKRVFTSSETIEYPVEICHFGKEELKSVIPYWRVVNEDGIAVREGEFNRMAIPLGKNIELGNLSLSLQGLPVPAAYTIEIGIKDTAIINRWNIWVYEEESDSENSNSDKDNENIIYTRSLQVALDALKKGKRVIYSPLPEHHRLDSPPLQPRTVFWNAQMGPTYGRGMGYICQNNHPALAKFPTKAYKEWQWDEIIQGAYGLNLSELPNELLPIVQPIDDWNRNYRLGMILECKVGEGSLLIVTANIEDNLSQRPAARQLRTSLFDYVASEAFNPRVSVSPEALKASFFPRLIMLYNGVKVKIEGQDIEDKDEFFSLLDGDPASYYTSELLKYPFTMELEVEEEAFIQGLIYMPRQNDRHHSGDIKGCRVEALIDGQWQEVYKGELISSLDPKRLLFHESIKTCKIRFTALYGFSGEGVATWYEDKDGWYQKIIDYKDTVAAIGDLLFIPVNVDLDQITYNTIKPNNLGRLQIHVTEKSATKEIDN
ncbi:MAG: hypothetical protein GX288_11345 [Clostridiales bacterium]|nr:hypothetical protein [Clostridiales bacterium]